MQTNATVGHLITGKRRQSGAVLIVALILMAAVSLLSIASVSTSTMELRMANNLESHYNNYQTAIAAVDYILSDSNNLPTSQPLLQPVAIALPGSPFSTSGSDSVTATAARTAECAAPPRMRNATSMTAFSAFNYEIASTVEKNAGGMGSSGIVQGYTLLGPKC